MPRKAAKTKSNSSPQIQGENETADHYIINNEHIVNLLLQLG